MDARVSRSGGGDDGEVRRADLQFCSINNCVNVMRTVIKSTENLMLMAKSKSY